jgi:hypothetical protein
MEDTAKLGDRNVVYSSHGQEGDLGLGKESLILESESVTYARQPCADAQQEMAQ